MCLTYWSKQMNNIYRMCIYNVAKKIQAQDAANPEEDHFTAFQAANILGVAFLKDEEEVLADIIMVKD